VDTRTDARGTTSIQYRAAEAPGCTSPARLFFPLLVLVRDKQSEVGILPSPEILAAMGTYNEGLVKAGVLLAGGGLHPSSKGVRVRFSGSSRIVIDRPLAETKELVAGFWLIQAKSMEEAIE
jgi:hypothetical protein